MNTLGSSVGTPLWNPALGIGIFVLLLWNFAWKGLALWRAAKRGEKIWFVVFLLVSTMGILEIVYIFFITGAKLSDFRTSGHTHQGSEQ